MLALIDGLPDNVVGVEATGKVAGKDYEDVLIPAIETTLADHDKVRLLYVLGDGFDGYEADAMWDDAKVGMQHIGRWQRIALVSDSGAYRTTVKAFGVLMPGHVRVFSTAETDDAKAWISED